jgi:hypothetical protein
MAPQCMLPHKQVKAAGGALLPQLMWDEYYGGVKHATTTDENERRRRLVGGAIFRQDKRTIRVGA